MVQWSLDRFTLSDLIECVHSCNQKLTCVIDLTYAKYYSSKFLHDNNIRYYKIYVEGHKVPDSKNGIIAVHCTHGVNRTGYFICRYLIDFMNVNPKDALQEFEYARGYPVERENYIKDLLSFVRKSNVISVEKNKRN
ncbi:RNA/RNP complex-1-interacting phosphatase [Schistosoma japonicum]|nr:RNA/RNP complex-1-interacting phosphatase [Schistosoma japonicum]